MICSMSLAIYQIGCMHKTMCVRDKRELCAKRVPAQSQSASGDATAIHKVCLPSGKELLELLVHFTRAVCSEGQRLRLELVTRPKWWDRGRLGCFDLLLTKERCVGRWEVPFSPSFCACTEGKGDGPTGKQPEKHNKLSRLSWSRSAATNKSICTHRWTSLVAELALLVQQSKGQTRTGRGSSQHSRRRWCPRTPWFCHVCVLRRPTPDGQAVSSPRRSSIDHARM